MAVLPKYPNHLRPPPLPEIALFAASWRCCRQPDQMERLPGVTRNALSALSDRELDDIGLVRW